MGDWKDSRPIDVGVCPFCYEGFDATLPTRRRTREHAIPKSWYPDDSWPFTRPQVYGCNECNGAHGELERALLVRMGFVFGSDNPNAVGIFARSLRAMSAFDGRDERDAFARERERQRFAASYEFVSPSGTARVLNPTGIKPHALRTAAGLHVQGNMGLSFDGDALHRVAKKMVRSLFAWETETLLPREAAVEISVLLPAQYKSVIDGLGSAFFRLVHRKLPPGVWYLFSRLEDDAMGSVVFICLWERLLIMGITHDPISSTAALSSVGG